MNMPSVEIVNPAGKHRVLVTKSLPGKHWLEVLTAADCRIEIAQGTAILSKDDILALIGGRCDGAIGQLTEPWDATLFTALKNAGGRAYSNYAVGYNNIDIPAATALGIPVGNTPGVLTETTAEITVALAFAASRRIVEADRFMRGGRFTGWLPALFLGQLFHGKTVGIIGAGRIGAAFARGLGDASGRENYWGGAIFMLLADVEIHQHFQFDRRLLTTRGRMTSSRVL